MIILRKKGRGILSINLLIRAAAYDTVRTRTFLPLHKTKTVERDTKRWIMVQITKTLGKDD